MLALMRLSDVDISEVDGAFAKLLRLSDRYRCTLQPVRRKVRQVGCKNGRKS